MAPVVILNCHLKKSRLKVVFVLAPNVWLKKRQLAKNAKSLVLFISAGWKEFSPGLSDTMFWPMLIEGKIN